MNHQVSSEGSGTGGKLESPAPYTDPATMRDQEQATNEHVFTMLMGQHAETERAVQFLEEALLSARFRLEVLESATRVLNAPQTAQAPL
jgi:hypothetical protein